VVYPPAVSDLPLRLPAAAASTLAAALDQERKIDRALETLGPVADRDVVVGGGPSELERLRSAGARTTAVDELPSAASGVLQDASADTIVSAWAGFRGVEPSVIAEVDRILRPGGRLLVVHDYGRDDVSRLRGELPEYGEWSRRDGPFLTHGFRVRVLHCFWTFPTVEDARAFLAEAFGAAGVTVGESLKRPRLSWNVALYHRTRGGVMEGTSAEDETVSPRSIPG